MACMQMDDFMSVDLSGRYHSLEHSMVGYLKGAPVMKNGFLYISTYSQVSDGLDECQY